MRLLRGSSNSGVQIRHQASRWEREERNQRVAIAVVIAAIIVAALVVLIPFIKHTVLDPRQVLARVGGITITRSEYQAEQTLNTLGITDPTTLKQVYAVYKQNPGGFADQVKSILQQNGSTTSSSVEGYMLDPMINNAVLEASQSQAGIRVTDQDVQNALMKYIGGGAAAATATAQPGPTTSPTSSPSVKTTPAAKATVAPTPLPPTQSQVSSFFSALRKGSGVSENDYKELAIKPALLRQQYIDKHVPARGPQVHVRHILVPTRAEAEQIIQQLKQGMKFEVLARQKSIDTSNNTKGGDLGWEPKGIYDPAFERAAFSLTKPGQIIGPIHSSFGWHVIQLLERDDNRPLTPDQKTQVGQKMLQDFIAQRRKALQADHQLKVAIPPTPTAAPSPTGPPTLGTQQPQG